MLSIMKKHIPKNIQLIVEEVKKRLINIYGENLEEVILYGSYARGDFTEESDIDIMILLKNMQDISTERERYFDAIWELDLKYDMLVSIIPFKKDEFDLRRLPLILNVKKEGILV